MAVGSVSTAATATTTGSNTNSTKIGGLVTGLDTETLVKQMTALSKTRIDSQKQKLDKLKWQQDSYRSVISQISSLKDSYFNLLKPDTNLSSNTLFGIRGVTSSNALVKASASSNATETTYNISEVIKQAKTAGIASTSKSVDGIKLDFSSASAQQYKINFTLDGLKKEVSFAGSTDAQTTKTNLLAAINSSFSTSGVSFEMNDNRLVAKDATYTDLAHSFSIASTTTPTSGVADELKALGLEDNTSSKMSSGNQLGNIAFSTKLEGNGFTFEINGTKFNFDRTSTLSNVMDAINKSAAGVSINYDSLGGKFNLEATTSGSGSAINIKQTSGNLLSALFGSDKIAASSSLSSASLISNGIKGVTPADGSGFGVVDGVAGDISKVLNKQLSVTVNGVSKEIGLWTYDSSGTKNDFTKVETIVTQLNSELTKNFGASAPLLSYDKTAKGFTLTTGATGDVVSINSVADTSGGSQALLTALGYDTSNNSNAVSDSTKLFAGMQGSGITAKISFGVGFDVNLDENSTIADLVNGSNGYMTFDNGILTLKGVDLNNTDAAGKTYLESIFGKGYNYPGVPASNPIASFSATGENAIIKVNGTSVTNNTNNFTIDGTTFDISGLSVGAVSASVTTSKDSTKAVDAVKKFVTDYNTLIDSLYKEVRTKNNTDYPPLTDDQRAAMSDTQVSAWEAKAKTGMLYQDQTVNKFLTTLRSAVNGRTSSGVSLVDIGINVSSDYLNFGKLEINENTLKTAFDTNAKNVQKLFTDATDGLSAKISKAIDGAVKTTGADKGSLVMIAGVANTTSDAENKITKQLASYKTLIDSLQTKYKAEQDRYWKQFTTLETATSKYNSQSAWLTSQFSQSSS